HDNWRLSGAEDCDRRRPGWLGRHPYRNDPEEPDRSIIYGSDQCGPCADPTIHACIHALATRASLASGRYAIRDPGQAISQCPPCRTPVPRTRAVDQDWWRPWTAQGDVAATRTSQRSIGTSTGPSVGLGRIPSPQRGV